MKNFDRIFTFNLLDKQSAFFWGPRQTGKSTLLKTKLKDSIYIDLLDSDLYFELEKRPALLREMLSSYSEEKLEKPIIIDEVQKIPALLDEIHWLIENKKLQFILCGSSARKLKRGNANLLGGRAWKLELFPFVSKELVNFNLLKALQVGLLPPHYLNKFPKKAVQSYIVNYLREEIQAEGIVRNIPSFSRFLDAAAFSHAELVNYSNISRDCGVSAKTVKEYFQILEDTMIGSHLYPYTDKISRDVLTKTPKFYYFDNGIANYLKKISFDLLKGSDAGKSLEAFIYHELKAYSEYFDKQWTLSFWRTKNDREIDFIIDQAKIAIEVKISSQVNKKDFKELSLFLEIYPNSRCILICNCQFDRSIQLDHGVIEILTIKSFLDLLWSDEI